MAQAARRLGRADAAAQLANLVERMANGGLLDDAERRVA
jgi:hypothetical protein